MRIALSTDEPSGDFPDAALTTQGSSRPPCMVSGTARGSLRVLLPTIKRLEPGEGSLATKVETMEKLQRALELAALNSQTAVSRACKFVSVGLGDKANFDPGKARIDFKKSKRYRNRVVGRTYPIMVPQAANHRDVRWWVRNPSRIAGRF